MTSRAKEPNRPFRWNLVRRDQLGSLLDGTEPPDLWYLDELVSCAAKVLARGSGGDLHFVGRSADSVFDLLSGVLSGTSGAARLHQLPLSIGGFFGRNLDLAETDQLRANLAAQGLDPVTLARAKRLVVFVDVVAGGTTYENLFHVLRDWVDDAGETWDVIRRKLHFLGITERKRTSPHTWRWHQHARWVSALPARAVRNVSLEPGVWSHFANHQSKVTPSFPSWRWSADWVRAPRHDRATRQALAEAVALVEAGRSDRVRKALVSRITAEPAMAEPWLRALVREVRAAR